MDHVVDITPDPDDDHREIATCTVCSSAVTGPPKLVEAWASNHERYNKSDPTEMNETDWK